MAAIPFKFVTGASTNLTLVKDGMTPFKGIVAVNTAAYQIYVKLYWFIPTSSAANPTVGTTVPDMTIAVPALGTTTGGLLAPFNHGVIKNGQLWIAVTKLAADSDTTAVAAGDGIITLLVE